MEVFDPQLFEQHAHHLRILVVHFLKHFLDVGEVLFLLQPLNVHVELFRQRTVRNNSLINQRLISVIHLCQLFQFLDVAERVARIDQHFGVLFVLDAIDDVDYIVDHVGDLAQAQVGREWFVGVGHEECPLGSYFGGGLAFDLFH